MRRISPGEVGLLLVSRLIVTAGSTTTRLNSQLRRAVSSIARILLENELLSQGENDNRYDDFSEFYTCGNRHPLKGGAYPPDRRAGRYNRERRSREWIDTLSRFLFQLSLPGDRSLHRYAERDPCFRPFLSEHVRHANRRDLLLRTVTNGRAQWHRQLR